MAAMMTATRRVLAHFDADITDGGGSQGFCPPDEVDGWSASQVWISTQSWEDMGRPKTITVTVEPGDRLNDPA